jgi:hypothetical protein
MAIGLTEAKIAWYRDVLNIPDGTAMSVTDLEYAFFSNPPALGGGGASFEANVGNGVLTTVPVIHNLDTSTPSVTVIDNSDNTVRLIDWTVVNANTINLVFPQAPATDEFRIAVRA